MFNIQKIKETVDKEFKLSKHHQWKLYLKKAASSSEILFDGILLMASRH